MIAVTAPIGDSRRRTREPGDVDAFQHADATLPGQATGVPSKTPPREKACRRFTRGVAARLPQRARSAIFAACPMRAPAPTFDARAPRTSPSCSRCLFYASHAHDEPGRTPEQLLGIPSLARYVVGFGRPGDLGVIAEDARGPVGAAWVRRRMLVGEGRGYGWVDDQTPELAVAVAPEVVGRGVGTRLMRELLARARDRYAAMSLSVRTDNPARSLYLRLGFVPVRALENRTSAACPRRWCCDSASGGDVGSAGEGRTIRAWSPASPVTSFSTRRSEALLRGEGIAR